MDNTRLTLLELNKKIRQTLETNFSEGAWVVAEISEIRLNRSGHCYLELIEKDQDADHIIARSRATIWAYTYRMLSPYFQSTTGQPLTSGMKVLFFVHVRFHEHYGLSLDIKDVDPTYTIGELEKQKIEIINRLNNEGVINMNIDLPLPSVIQNIAVISSSGAAGYQDFIHQLNQNPYGYAFHTKLYEAVMQGEKSSESIIYAFECIFDELDDFDAIAIIRGGGSQADLSCFNNYDVAFHITQIPVPVLSGIGHDRDQTVVDLVAHQHLKTPTAVADFLISQASHFEEHLQYLSREISDSAMRLINEQKRFINTLVKSLLSYTIRSGSKKRSKLSGYNQRLQYLVKHFLSLKRQYKQIAGEKLVKNGQVLLEKKQNSLTQNWEKIYIALQTKLNEEKQKLEISRERLHLLDPANTLKRGYTITCNAEGRIIKDAQSVKEGEIIQSRFFNGQVDSEIKNIQINEESA
jgi:exodeoxyribonuclease VII large subunit